MALLSFINVQLLTLIYVLTLSFVVYFVWNSLTWSICASIAALFICVKAIGRKSTGTVAVNAQGILITGCDTGFGHDLSMRLDELGFTVFAGCLYPNGDGANLLRSRSSNNLHIVSLDVGKDESVKAAHAYVSSKMPESGLWAIVNNAGFHVMGDVEWLTVDLYNKVMNVNFYGAVRTITTFLYLVRKTKGRVVNVTSVRGVFPFPCESPYHASKHALETMTDSLRLEMQKFDVKVSKVRPGCYGNATGIRRPEHFKRYRIEADEMWNHASDDVRSTYGRDYLDAKIIACETFPRDYGALTTKPVVDAIVHALTSDTPCKAYIVDGNGLGWVDPDSTLARYYGYLPTCLADWIITKKTNCNRFPDSCHSRKDLQQNSMN